MTEEFVSRLEQARQARRERIAQFRMEQVKELPDPLPVSGLRVWVRDATMMDLVFSGKLPEPMLEVIQQLQDKGDKEVDIKQLARNGAEFSEMVDAMVMIAVVEPPIAEKGDDEHIGIHELPGEDRMAIFNWLNREAKEMRSFRDGEQPVAVVQPGDGVPAETQ